MKIDRWLVLVILTKSAFFHLEDFHDKISTLIRIDIFISLSLSLPSHPIISILLRVYNSRASPPWSDQPYISCAISKHFYNPSSFKQRKILLNLVGISHILFIHKILSIHLFSIWKFNILPRGNNNICHCTTLLILFFISFCFSSDFIFHFTFIFFTLSFIFRI